jgi:hypothetical protein
MAPTTGPSWSAGSANRSRPIGLTNLPRLEQFLALSALAIVMASPTTWATTPSVGSESRPALAHPGPNLVGTHGVTILTAPYRGLSSNRVHGPNLRACYPGSGGGWGRTPVTGRWDSARGVFLLKANVSTSSACWTNSTPANLASGFGAKVSGELISIYDTLSMPVYLSGVSGVEVNLTVAYKAHEFFVQSPSRCTYNKTEFKNGYECQDSSLFSFAVIESIRDTTTHTNYCNGFNSTGACFGPFSSSADHVVDSHPCQWNCYVGSNAVTNGSSTVIGNVSGNFSSAHHYRVVIAISAHLQVYLYGWKGHASAGVDLADPGLGVRLNSITIW